jgi:hypothetical protein
MKRVSLILAMAIALVAAGAACSSTDAPLIPVAERPQLDCGPGTYGSGHVCSAPEDTTTNTTSLADTTERGPGTYGSGH